MLKGEAVFVYDDTTDSSRYGAYRQNEAENDKRVYYVQEMLNQVVPRKRTLTNPPGLPPANPANPTAYAYSLMDEGGRYAAETANRLLAFKHNFNLGVNDTVGFYAPGGAQPYDSNDNTSSIFRKLMKDYGKRQTGALWLVGGTGADSWLHKVVDKDTLIKSERRIPASNEQISTDNADVLINNTAGSTRNDTGLYELYKNVVERFVSTMIEKGEHYAGLQGNPLPSDNWVSRGTTATNGYGSAGCANSTPTRCSGEHGQGISYSFGGKQTVENYNDTVSRWKAPPNTLYPAMPQDYRGDVNDATGAVGAVADLRRWVGLYDTEINADSLEQPYYPRYWAGIDCSGLANRTLQYARQTMNANGNAIVDLDVPIQIHPTDATRTAFYTEDTAMEWMHNSTFFENANISYSRSFNQVQQWIRRGDVLRYGNTHVSVVHSIRPVCTTTGTGARQRTTCTYEIVHASGNERVCYGLPGEAQTCTAFNRKVTINEINRRIRGTLGSPTGFGRIKLWD